MEIHNGIVKFSEGNTSINTKKFIFHIGMPKCGSSAVQKFLCSSDFIKITNNNICYVVFRKNGEVIYGNKVLSLAKNPYEYVCSDAIFKIDELKLQLSFNQLFNQYSTIICSTEWWGYSEIENFINIAGTFIESLKLDFDLEIRILMFIRPQIEWLNSAYWQWGAWECSSLETFFEKYLEIPNYYLKVKKILKELPYVKVDIIVMKGNVVEDFINYLGLKLCKNDLDFQKYVHNPSLPSIILKLFQKYRHLRPGPHKSSIDFIIKKYLPLNQFKSSPWIISHKKVEELLTYYQPYNLQLLNLLEPEQKERMLNDEKWWSIKAYQNKKYEEPNTEFLDFSELEKLAVCLIEILVNLERNIKNEERVSPKARPYIKFKIEYLPCKEIEFMRIDGLQADLLREGRLNIGGLVLLKKELEGEYKILVKDEEGEKEAKWGLPSTGLASQHPDNPKAKNARFQINGIKANEVIEIILKNSETKIIAKIEF